MNIMSAGKDEKKKNLLKLDKHEPNSLYRCPAVGDLYGTGIKIWAGFGPVGITEKKIFGPIMSKFLGCFFQVSLAKKIKNIVASALKS